MSEKELLELIEKLIKERITTTIINKFSEIYPYG